MDKDLQGQINELKVRLDAFNASPTIPLQVDQAWNARGFIKTDFFVAGTGSFNAFGTYTLIIPGSTKNSIALITGYPTSTFQPLARMTPAYAQNNYGSSTSQFDITNPAGTTFRYTWDGTGSNPNINLTTIPIGSRLMIASANFNAGNTNNTSTPFFTTTGAGTNYFEISNASGIAENNKTLGASGSIIGGPVTKGYALSALGVAAESFAFVVFLFPGLFVSI